MKKKKDNFFLNKEKKTKSGRERKGPTNGVAGREKDDFCWHVLATSETRETSTTCRSLPLILISHLWSLLLILTISHWAENKKNASKGFIR